MTDYTTHIIRKPRVESVQQVTICAGDPYEGILITQDTILQSVYSSPAQDSIIWTYIDVMPLPETTIIVTLEEAGLWEGIAINQDTMITQIIPSDSGCDQIVHYEISLLTQLDAPHWVVDWQIGPNPVSDQLSLHRTGDSLPAAELRLIQSDGREVYRHSIGKGVQEIHLASHNWARGTYFLEIRQDQEWYRWVMSKI